jgi:hypothetical protein
MDWTAIHMKLYSCFLQRKPISCAKQGEESCDRQEQESEFHR